MSISSDPPALRLSHGQCTTATLHWNALRALDDLNGHPVAFVHLVDNAHEVTRTFDHPLSGTWTPGTRIDDPIEVCESLLAPALKPGHYRLIAGLYDSGSGRRWPPRETDLASVDVLPGNVEGELQFEGGWRPLTLTGDQQIVARRIVAGDASIVIVKPRTSTLRMTIGVGDKARAVVSSSCVSSARQEFVTGSHRLTIPACEHGTIRIEPSGGLVFVETVAWSTAPASARPQ